MVRICRLAPWALALVAAGAPMLVLMPARGASAPVTIAVPTDQPTIQAAITAAQNGDTVVVAPGTYRENLDFHGKAITVASAQGPASTVVDGTKHGPVVTFQTGETPASVLEGFTLRDGTGPADPRYGGGGVRIVNASPTIAGNVITQNAACAGGGVMVTGGAPVIHANTVTANLASDSTCSFGGGAGVELDFTDAQLTGNTITNNSQASAGAGVHVGGGSPLLLDNVVSDNTGVSWGAAAGVSLDATGALVVQNLITSNSGGPTGGVDIGGNPTAGHPTLVNNTIAANQGDAVEISGSTAAPPVELDGNVVVAVPGRHALVCGADGPLTPTFLDNTLFTEGPPADQGCDLGPPTGGNITGDPGFVDPVHGDFQLSATSPSVDTGDPAAPGLPTTDLNGAPRVQGGGIDQGAYESSGASEYVPHAPATITVPGQEPTITAAITAAHDGDTVLVSPGTYRENLDFGGKAITLESAQGPAVTVIDGAGSPAPVVDLHSGEPPAAVLRGFTLEHGTAPLYTTGYGGGVRVNLASPTIEDNVVVDNASCDIGAGIGVSSGSPLIEGNTVSGNVQGTCTGGDGGGGIGVQGASSSVQIIGNTVTGNSGTAAAVSLRGIAAALVENNVISQNLSGRATTGGLLVESGQAVVVQNLIAGNAGAGLVGSADGPGSSLLLVGNTIADNRTVGLHVGASGGGHAELDGNIVVAAGGSHSQAIVCSAVDPSSQLMLNDNDAVAGKATGYAGCPAQPAAGGNISADPRFVDAKRGDDRLAPGSPAIDTGDSTAPQLPATDLAGSPRVQGRAVDMGAYESTPIPPPAQVGSLTATWSKTTLRVSWTAPIVGTPPTSYQLMLSPGGTVRTVKASSTSVKLTHLTPSSTTYTVTVVAVNSAGAGAPATLTLPATG